MSTSVLAADAAPGRPIWRLLSSEPHRLMFFFGALQSVVAVAWWSCDLAARYLGVSAAISWTVPPAWAHAWLLLYGLFPFFIFGFLMTAGPNWLGAKKMPRSAFVPAALAMASGLILVYVGLVTGRTLAAAGAFLHVAGWLWGTTALMRVAAMHWNPNARYAVVIFTFLSIGIIGDAVFALAIARASYEFVPHALNGAVWFFLLPIYLGVSTRMVPFFSSRILGASVEYRPAWARPALIGLTIAHGVLELNGLHALLWIVDLPLALIVLRLSLKWGLGRSGGVRLLAVLHISLGVLAFALAVSAVSSIAVAIGAAPRLGLAPLHLIAIGYFVAMAVAMVSRVSLGHSGRPLEADRLTWYCYLGVIATAALRTAAEYAPADAVGPMMAATAVLWLISLGVWTWRYVPMYLSPRVDAR